MADGLVVPCVVCQPAGLPWHSARRGRAHEWPWAGHAHGEANGAQDRAQAGLRDATRDAAFCWRARRRFESEREREREELQFLKVLESSRAVTANVEESRKCACTNTLKPRYERENTRCSSSKIWIDLILRLERP